MKSLVKDHLQNGNAAYTCPVRFELVLGARPSELEGLNLALEFSHRIVATPAHWDHTAGLAASLKAKGLNFPALDLLIASVAHTEKITLLTCDRHFMRIRDEVLPGLVIEPQGMPAK